MHLCRYGCYHNFQSLYLTHGGRRPGSFFFFSFRWVMLSKSSVNISVASWFTTVISELRRFIRVAFKLKSFSAFLSTSSDRISWCSQIRPIAYILWAVWLWDIDQPTQSKTLCPLWQWMNGDGICEVCEPRWWDCICKFAGTLCLLWQRMNVWMCPWWPRWWGCICNFALRQEHAYNLYRQISVKAVVSNNNKLDYTLTVRSNAEIASLQAHKAAEKKSP